MSGYVDVRKVLGSNFVTPCGSIAVNLPATPLLFSQVVALLRTPNCWIDGIR